MYSLRGIVTRLIHGDFSLHLFRHFLCIPAILARILTPKSPELFISSQTKGKVQIIWKARQTFCTHVCKWKVLVGNDMKPYCVLVLALYHQLILHAENEACFQQPAFREGKRGENVKQRLRSFAEKSPPTSPKKEQDWS